MKWNKYPETKPNKAFPNLDLSVQCLVVLELMNPLGGSSLVRRLAYFTKDKWIDYTADIIYDDVKWFFEIDSLPEPEDNNASPNT